MNIPLCIPYVDKKEEEAVLEVLRSGWYAHGPKNKEFELLFADKIGVKHAIALNSCTSALQLALQIHDITGEVIVPSFTFVASANSIVTAGATPVFIDIDPVTNNLDVSKLEQSITANSQAIMPVHFGGLCCNMTAIMNFANKHNLIVIEDSAETLGGMHKGKQAGSFGTGCFSFFPTKNITTGEGGMLTTNDDALMEKARALMGHGILKTTLDREEAPEPWERSASIPGYNFRMSNLLAAIGVEQMKKLDEMNKRRRENASFLNHFLGDIKEIEIPFEGPDDHHVYQMYTIKVNKSILRNKLVHYLRENGIGASVHFDPPVHKQTAYLRRNELYKLEITEDIASRILTLPMFPSLSNEQIEYICFCIKSFFANSRFI